MHRPNRIADLLREEVAFVHRLAHALLRDPELAFDVAQDTLTAAWQHPPRATSRPQFRAFLRTIAKRLAAAAVRGRAERTLRERAAASPEASDAESRARDHLDLHRRLVAAVEALPEPYRTTVVLHFVRDLPPRAIARELETSAEVVRQRLHRGLAMLRERLDREPGGRSAWTAAIVAAGLSPLPHVALLGALMTKKLLGLAAILIVAVGAWMVTPLLSEATSAEHWEGTANAVANAVHDDDANRTMVTAPDAAVVRASASLRVHVRDTAGRPVPGATVHDCRSNEPPLAIPCDGDGDASLSLEPGARELVVRSPNHLSAWASVPADASETTITLASGTALEGTVLVDGAAAGEGLELSLLIEPTPDSLRSERSEVAARLLAEDETRKARTLAGGGFVFANLPIDWHGTLVAPDTHWILDDRGEPGPMPRALDLAAGPAELTLRTTQLPSLRGRVLYDDGTPAGGAKILAQGAFEDRTHSERAHAVADAEGGFVLSFAPQWIQHRAKFADANRRPALLRANILVGALDTQRTTVEWTAPVDRNPVAVHTVELRIARLPAVHFVVLDERSRPLAGARMLTDHLSPPTDDRGRGIAHGTPLGVAAPDHLVAPAHSALRGIGTVEDPMVFALQPSRMVFRVRAPDGSPLRGCSLEARYPAELLPALPELSALYLTAWNIPGQPHRNDDRSWQLNLALDGEATAHAPGLTGGTRCRVRVRDSLGTVLGEYEVAPPHSTEAVDVVVHEPTSELRGRVHAAGVAQRRSTVTVRAVADDGWAHRKPVNPDGSFAIECLRSRTPWEVLVEAEGFAPLRVAATAGTFLDLELQKGRSVEVAVLDAEGRAVAVRDLGAVELRDTQLRPHELGVGRFRFDDVPLEPVTFRCHLGGRAFEVVAAAGATTATLQLPALATLRVGGGASATEGVLAQCLDPSGDPFRAFLRDGVCLLPPGRYRFENATPAEVVLRAGESAEIALH